MAMTARPDLIKSSELVQIAHARHCATKTAPRFFQLNVQLIGKTRAGEQNALMLPQLPVAATSSDRQLLAASCKLQAKRY